MMGDNQATPQDDPFGLERFVRAQVRVYSGALAELKGGRKRSHWIWFIFPQIDGLGSSSNSKFYGIKSLAEAQAYLAHPLLGPRLRECTEAVLAVEGRSVHDIFGSPDDVKFKSSMTLFECASGPNSVFARALDKYFNGKRDSSTLERLEQRL